MVVDILKIVGTIVVCLYAIHEAKSLDIEKTKDTFKARFETKFENKVKRSKGALTPLKRNKK